jgi:hypothetical protein
VNSCDRRERSEQLNEAVARGGQLCLEAAAAQSGPVPDELRTKLLAPRLWLAEAIRLTLLPGILCLMSIKPDILFFRLQPG